VFLTAWQKSVHQVFGPFSVVLMLTCPLLIGIAATAVWWRWLFTYIPFLERTSSWPSFLRDLFWVCLGMTFIGLIPVFYDVDDFFYRRWLDSFLPVEATVSGTRIDEVERGHRIGLAPRVLYEFRVNGTEYTGHKIHWELLLGDPPEAGGGPPPISSVIWDRERSDYSQKTLTNFLKQYSAGKKVTVYYDPKDPRNSCLVFVPWTRPLMEYLFVPMLILVIWSIFAFAWKIAYRAADLSRSDRK
jgi:hypothetical protein